MNKTRSAASLPILTLTFRLVLGIVFIYAALDKIIQPADFARSIQNYDLIPAVLTNLFAILLPWLELFCGILLIVGFFLRGAATITAALCVLFIFVLATALIRGLNIDCGCYGVSMQISINRIFEDIGLLTMAVYIMVFPDSTPALDNLLSGHSLRKRPDAASD